MSLGKPPLLSEDLPGEDVAGGARQGQMVQPHRRSTGGEERSWKIEKSTKRDFTSSKRRLEAAPVNVKVTHVPRDARGHRGRGRGSLEGGSGAQGGVRQDMHVWGPEALSGGKARVGSPTGVAWTQQAEEDAGPRA